MICTRNGMLVYLVVEVVEGDPILGQQVVETLREVPHAQLIPGIRTTITTKIKRLQVSVYVKKSPQGHGYYKTNVKVIQSHSNYSKFHCHGYYFINIHNPVP